MNIVSIWQHYFGYQYVATNQVRFPVPVNLSHWLHTLSHCSSPCIYLRAYKDHFYKLPFQPQVQVHLPGIYNCCFVWKISIFPNFIWKCSCESSWWSSAQMLDATGFHKFEIVFDSGEKGSILKFLSISDFLMSHLQVGGCTGCSVLLLLIIQIIPFSFPLKMEIDLKSTLMATTHG